MTIRALSAGFATSIGASATTIGVLLSITMPDATVKRFNSFGSLAFSFSGQTWNGYPGFNITGMTITDGNAAPTIEIDRGVGLDTLLTFIEAASGVASGAEVVIYLVDFVSGASHNLGSKWRIGKIDTGRDGLVVFDIVSLARRNKQLFLKRYVPPCQWHLGDVGCGIDLDGSPSFTDTVTVVTNADAYNLTVSGSSRADDEFNLGAMKFLTGDLTGQSFDVRDWTLSGGVLVLAKPLTGAAGVGDTATIHTGCDKSNGAAGCAFYSNQARYFGFRHLPEDNQEAVADPPPTITPEDDLGWWWQPRTYGW